MKRPSDVLIGYREGCSNSVAAAHVLNLVLKKMGFTTKCVAIAHSQYRFTRHVQPGQMVFCVDVSPSKADVDVLQFAQSVFIWDLQIGEISTRVELSELLPGKVINLGDASGQHCGAWLAHNLVTADVAGIGLDPDVIQMIRQIDAFQHKMPQWSKSAHQSLIEQVNVRKVHKECNALTRAFLREEHSEGAIDTRTSQPVLGWTTQLFEFSARKNVVGPKPTKQQTKQQRRYRKAPELDGQRSCSRCGKVRLTREQLDAVDAVHGVDSCKKESCDNMSMTSTAPSLADVQGALDMTVSRHDQNVALQDNAPFIVHKKDGVFVLYKISGLPTVDSTRKGKKAKKVEKNVGQWLHEQFGLDKDTLGWTGLVHRLDKGTSGVLLAGWHESAHQALIKQRNARKLRKEKVALIRGPFGR